MEIEDKIQAAWARRRDGRARNGYLGPSEAQLLRRNWGIGPLVYRLWKSTGLVLSFIFAGGGSRLTLWRTGDHSFPVDRRQYCPFGVERIFPAPPGPRFTTEMFRQLSCRNPGFGRSLLPADRRSPVQCSTTTYWSSDGKT